MLSLSFCQQGMYRESRMCFSMYGKSVYFMKAMNVLANMGVRARASCFT